jgi:hypothetical protein
MPVRKTSNRPLQTKEQRNKTYAKGFAYAHGILSNGLGPDLPGPPFSTIVARTLMQRAWYDAYRAALRDVRDKFGIKTDTL